LAARKFNFLNSGEPQVKEDIKEEVKDSPIIDTKIIEYIISEFPVPTKDISSALVNLQITLEKTIDFIEDKSSEIIKTNRDFNLSSKYRDTSIRLHHISTSLKEYVNWMDVVAGKNTIIDTTEVNSNEETFVEEDKSNIYMPIYSDFTGITPLKFSIDNFCLDADNWDDLIMKTADILTKNYKDNKESEMIFPQHTDVIIKKSHENELRDTIIEMLLEYKINLSDYKILPSNL